METNSLSSEEERVLSNICKVPRTGVGEPAHNAIDTSWFPAPSKMHVANILKLQKMLLLSKGSKTKSSSMFNAKPPAVVFINCLTFIFH